jgi:deazaflavin-dependent oxidoreductase (nitroreductase family)
VPACERSAFQRSNTTTLGKDLAHVVGHDHSVAQQAPSIRPGVKGDSADGIGPGGQRRGVGKFTPPFYRQSQGQLRSVLISHAVQELQIVGARSGTERVTPVGCFNLGDDRFAIVASNGGSPTHPAWYYNLKANPRTKAEVGTESFAVLAEEFEGTARAELWPKLVAMYPTVGEHQAKTVRQVPVIVLTRQD